MPRQTTVGQNSGEMLILSCSSDILIILQPATGDNGSVFREKRSRHEALLILVKCTLNLLVYYRVVREPSRRLGVGGGVIYALHWVVG